MAHGGRLTGISALHEAGAWLLDPPAVVHVAVPPHASRRSPVGVVLHWEASSWSRDVATVGLGDALVRAVFDESLERSVPCFDWAFATGRLDHFGFEELLLRLPAAAESIRAWVDPNAESILESIARVRLLRRGWRVRSQVRVGDTGRIDLVVEDAIAIELDGRTFHESSFEADRRKDLAITEEGRHAVRLSHSMLRTAWPQVERAVEAALTARRLAGIGGVPPTAPHAKRRRPARRARNTSDPRDTPEYPDLPRVGR